MALREPTKGLTPKNWASYRPFGIGEQRPNNFKEVFRAAWENSDNASYAWKILNEGVCDGCALGTKGLQDWTLDGVHLCNIRLRLLRLNTMGPIEGNPLGDVAALRSMRGQELRRLGRLPTPMIRRSGEPGFRRIPWGEALEIAGARIREAAPERMGFFVTSRGMTNENYYAAQKVARALGTNSIDNAARICHSPSTFALKGALGVAATTCSYSDWIGTDLIVFIGSNVANNQPVTTKYIHMAKKAGTKIAVVNPYREPGMERYWIPSKAESALFGTKIADRFFQIDTGGDIGFLTGVLKAMVENGWTAERFINERTSGFEAAAGVAEAADWGALERLAGTSRAEMTDLARMLGEADRGVLVWSMGVTQHSRGEDGVRAIVNLGLARGWVGREGCGLMPIRGHSGVQGGAEMGCYSTAFPGGKEINAETAAELGEAWGFEVPAEPGLTAPEMLDAAERGELDVLFASGGNFMEVLPDPDQVEERLKKVPLRIHMDIVVSSQMLVDPAEGGEVLLLPAATRYETEGGVTETTTERRVVLSPEIKGHRIDDAWPEWQALTEIAMKARPELAGPLRFDGTPDIRREIAKLVPAYEQIANLSEGGDSFQYGGPMLCAGERFDTPDGLAHFAEVAIGAPPPDDGKFKLSTRRGKQFNSIVQEHGDAITGAVRESVLISADDAAKLGLPDGARVILRSDHGELPGNLLVVPIASGNLQVHWPEGNVLLGPESRSEEAGIPDYNARVEVVRA